MEEKEKRIKNIEKAPLAQGQKELTSYLRGNRLTLSESILAHCYDCMGFYVDGKDDCEMELCPLYPFMPYNPNKSKFKAETVKAPV